MPVSRFYYLQICFFGICVFLMNWSSCNRVLELSDRFLEVRNDGVWLVKFYAPWCGHCKNLEPVWSQVAQSLVDTNIRVSRLDCTRFTGVATEFGVHGFPTILFIKGHKTVEYRGDRIRDDIVNFARRMDGPPVRHLSNCADLETAKKIHNIFFLYVDGEQLEPHFALKDNYTRIAEDFQPYIYFFTAPQKCLQSAEALGSLKEPTIVVFKDKTRYIYEGDKGENNSLSTWVNEERFPTFFKITNGNFHQLLKTEKYIVVAVLQENQIGGLTMKMQEFYDLVEAIALNNKDVYHENFMFGYLSQPDIANSVAMMELPVPSLIVINSKNYQYHLPNLLEEEKVPSPQAIVALLDEIVNKSAKAYGGDTYLYRIYRTYFEAKISLAGMWKGNPVLTTLLLGLPLGLLSIICYTSCCSDIMEAGEEEEEAEQSERHQKRE